MNVFMNIDPFVKEIEKQKLNVESIIVSQNNRISASYHWVNEKKKNIFSVSKSFTSIAVGMLAGEEKLKLSDKVIDFFPQKKTSPRLSSLKIEHLLTMTRGHGAFTRPKSLEEALSAELDFEPGEKFFYDNACTFLLSAVITKISGLKLRDFLLDRLFKPLDIDDPEWQESEDGYTLGATGLFLSVSDMLRFGQFLLLRGEWNYKQLVSSAWIEGATRTQVETKNSLEKPDWNLGYGWQFWICRHGAYRCDGKDGQYIIVIPRLNTVIAVTSNEEKMEPILYAVWDKILKEI